jgi:ribosome-binding factor A
MADRKRVERVKNELNAVLAEILLRGVKDPRVGSVSITGVLLSSDLKVARVRYLSLGGQKDPREVQAGLRAAAGYLRREVGNRMSLRVVPELVFENDVEFDNAIRVTRILSELDIPKAAQDPEGEE